MPPHTKTTAYHGPSCRQKRGSSLSSSSSCCSDSDSGSEHGGETRQLLRTWLMNVASRNVVPGVKWMDEDHTLLKIPWTHGSRQGFNFNTDSQLFRLWAVHSKIFNEDEDQPDPKRWKANFRCAMNSLPDVKEETEQSRKKGAHAFKVYRFLEEKPRKSLKKYKQGKTSTKATKKEKLSQERTKKLARNIAEQTRRQLIVGVRSKKSSSSSSSSCSSSPASSPLKAAPMPVTVETIAQVQSPPCIRRNSQLLNRFVSRSQVSSVIPAPATTTVSATSPQFIPTLAPFPQRPHDRSSPISASPPPAELTQAASDRGYPLGGQETARMETLSPTTSIPTFVEEDCEDFAYTLGDGMLPDGISEDDLATCALEACALEASSAFMNSRVETIVEAEAYRSPVMHNYSSASNGSSSPTLSSLNGQPDEEEVMEIDCQELGMTRDADGNVIPQDPNANILYEYSSEEM